MDRRPAPSVSSQSAEWARAMRQARPTGHRLSVWDALDLLTDFRDTSAGASATSPIHHAFQTAETLRCAGASDWMVVVGLVHDVGMVLARLRPGPGTDDATQWGLTGPVRVLERGPPGGGLDRCLVSYGHGEYLYRVLTRTPGVQLPDAGMRVVRYHELAGWLDGDLADLEDDRDRHARAIVARFRAADDHSRPDAPVTPGTAERLKHRYLELVSQWLPDELWW